jgi:predicted RND superfamily exporter protein
MLAFIAYVSYGIRFIEFSSNERVFFRKDDPKLKALEELENTYSRDNNVFFVIATADKDIFSRRTLSAIEELTVELWEIPYSRRVNSITNFQYIRTEDGELKVENLVQNAIELSDEDLERIKQIALSEPLLSGYLVSKTGSVTGIYVTITTPENSIDAIPQITEFARKKAKEFGEKYPELDVYLTGGVLFIHAFTEVSQSDMKKLIPIMFVVVATIIFFSLRSFTGTFATVLITIFSAVFAMGFAGWAGIEITIPSAIAPIIIVTLAIADSIHILNTTFYHMRVGKSKDEALLESLRSNMEPVFLTSLTTAIGFLSMNASDASPFHDLGNTVAVGVMAAYLFSQLLLPALISILPINVKTIQRNKIISIDKFGAFVVKRQKAIQNRT